VLRCLCLFLFGWSLVFLVEGRSFPFEGWSSSRVGGEDVEGGREFCGGILWVEVGVAWGVVGDFLRGDGRRWVREGEQGERRVLFYHCGRISGISCAGTHIAARVDIWEHDGVFLFI